jgi:hypothetical protein
LSLDVKEGTPKSNESSSITHKSTYSSVIRETMAPSIWNPDAILPPATRIRPLNVGDVGDDGDGSSDKQEHPPANPEQEAARMGALKRLRHKLVTLCSQQQQSGYGNGAKPPTLSMERWMSRYALERDLEASAGALSEKTNQTSSSDPILPSSGLADPGMVKDLSRSIAVEEAQKIAEAMAVNAQASGDRISSMTDQISSELSADNKKNKKDYWKDAQNELKNCTKAVKKTSKSIQVSLDKVAGGSDSSDNDDINDDDESDSTNLETSLAALEQATTALNTCRQKIQRMSDLQSGGNVVLDASRRSGICDIMLLQADGSPKKPYHTIAMAHLIKLVQLWQLNSKEESRPISPKAISKDAATAIQGGLPDAKEFLKYLYCCLTRYETIKGAGYQCAVPPIAFDAAHTDLGLGMTLECFASPLNCRYRNYCSAFPDLERPFGSLGSFFDDRAFFPTHGSFEANPPFVPEIMYAMNTKLQRLLENPKATALSFLVIVPVWGASGTGYVDQLEASDYCMAMTRVLATDHSFCDGAQHKALKQELRPSSWDTAVILLQNPKGAKEWPVSEDKLDSAFGSALKGSKAKGSLTDWEQRGVGRGGKQSHAPNPSQWNNKKNDGSNHQHKRNFQQHHHQSSSGKSSDQYAGKRTKL